MHNKIAFGFYLQLVIFMVLTQFVFKNYYKIHVLKYYYQARYLEIWTYYFCCLDLFL